MLYAAVHKPSLQVYTAFLCAYVGISFLLFLQVVKTAE